MEGFSEKTRDGGAASTALPGLNPIIFNGGRFERVANYGAHVGGDPDLYVAYGACTRP